MTENLETRFLSLRKQYIAQQFGKLNEVQQQAVYASEGPLLILAGAGSGKTTVLVNRIANLIRFGSAYQTSQLFHSVTEEMVEELETLIAQGGAPSYPLSKRLSVNAIYPYHILAITFTNKAAGELKNRLETMLGQEGQDVHASTFHSACVRILRRDGERLGYPKSFTIYDMDDQQRTMKAVYQELQVDNKLLPVKAALSAISRLKDRLISPKEAMETQGDNRAALVAKIYQSYQRRLKKAGAFDFDDLIYCTVQLLQENEDVREFYQKRYRYILVDEYQDTSIAQFRLVYLLGGAHQNVCVVGDDDQSIYRFRGATIENILNFEEHFPGAQVIRLEQNYRSTSRILQAANCVIQNNKRRKGKTLWTDNQDGESIVHYEADSELDEAANIAAIISRNVNEGETLHDHAVLYRMNAQSGPIETYFARSGIPYKIVGGQRFYDRKEIKDILAYMCLVANDQDDLRLRRIINEPARKIGATTIQNIARLATENEMSMLNIIKHSIRYPALGRATVSLQNFYRIYIELVELYNTLPLDLFVGKLIDETGYRAMLEASGEEGQTRLENIGQLISSVKTYADQRGPEASLEGFLEEVALINDLDQYDQQADVVVLMTLHAAKGLEFDHVFMVGLEEGIFPSEMSRYSQDDLEEERRLCYVGITRARKTLCISSASSRMLFGQTKRNRPSRFLEEIDPDLIEVKQSAARAKYQQQSQYKTYISTGYTPASQNTLTRRQATVGAPTLRKESAAAPVSATNTSKQFKAGDIVQHKIFGRGKVLKATPVSGDTIVEIQFESAGIKKTMANYAPMQHADV